MLHLLNYVNITGDSPSPVGGPSVPLESFSITSAVTDPMSTARFQVLEQPPALAILPQQQYICIDETGIANPTHNFLCNGDLSHPTGVQWSIQGISGVTLIDLAPGIQFQTVNAANASFAYELQNVQLGYVVPGQKYCVSVYETVTATISGSNAVFKFDFLDSSGNILSGGASDFHTSTGGGQIRIALTGTAPANAASIQVVMGMQATSNTNSGTVQFVNVQCECEWFPNQGVSYPTPLCVSGQANCYVLPDSTVVRQTRLFAGYVQTAQAEYEGTLRTWTVVVASNSILIDTFYLVNTNYVNALDSTGIINSSVNANYTTSSQFVSSGNGVYTQITTNHTVAGVTIDYLSVTDMTFKDVLATLANSSGFYYYVDPYFDLHYAPPGYDAAGFGLAGNGTAPNASPTDGSLPTYAFYSYKYVNDGSQVKNRVKVFGGKFLAPAITDSFTGDGSTKNFLLSQQPYNVQQVLNNGVDITHTTGVSGVQTLGVGGIVALYDKATPTLKFQTAPGNGNAVKITYTYENNVIIRTRDVGSIGQFGGRIFDSKINDTSLNSVAAADQRGLAELVQFSVPRGVATLTVQQYLPAGQSVQVTSGYDGLSKRPFLVQRSIYRYKGNGIYESAVELGAYNPDLVAILVSIHKALLRNPTTAGQTIVDERLMLLDTLYATETITFTALGTGSSNKYGTGVYGTTGYG